MGRQESDCREGKVIAVGSGVLRVALGRAEACGSCAAKGLCGFSGTGGHEVEVPVRPEGEAVSVGDVVTVEMREDAGMWAAFLGYFLPLAVLVAALVSLSGLLGMGELPAGGCALGAVGVYYLALWLCRGRLRHRRLFALRVKNQR